MIKIMVTTMSNSRSENPFCFLLVISIALTSWTHLLAPPLPLRMASRGPQFGRRTNSALHAGWETSEFGLERDFMRALVVEDSKTIRMILCQYLRKMGIEVVEAADGREALERLKEMSFPDLVLVDWNMPVMSGWRGDGSRRQRIHPEAMHARCAAGKTRSPRPSQDLDPSHARLARMAWALLYVTIEC
jgi:hypothetical protein